MEAAIRAAAPKIDVRLLMNLFYGIGKDSSGYGQVAHLRSNIDPALRTVWIAPGPPITAAFVPWRIGVGSIPPEYRMHRYLTAGEAERFLVDTAQRGLESTYYADRAVKRLLYLVQEHRDAFLPEVIAALEGFEARELESQGDVENTGRILLEPHQPALAQHYLTDQASMAAKSGLDLIQGLATGIEVRTKALYGIRTPETPPDETSNDRF
jgi:dipeptidase